MFACWWNAIWPLLLLVVIGVHCTSQAIGSTCEQANFSMLHHSSHRFHLGSRFVFG